MWHHSILLFLFSLVGCDYFPLLVNIRGMFNLAWPEAASSTPEVTTLYNRRRKQREGGTIPPGPTLGGVGPNWEQFRSAQVLSQLALKSVELGAGTNWEQLVQLA